MDCIRHTDSGWHFMLVRGCAHIEIEGHVGGGIFINGEGCAGVLNEEVCHAHFKAMQLVRELSGDIPGHYVAAPWLARQRDGPLNPAATPWCSSLESDQYSVALLACLAER